MLDALHGLGARVVTVTARFEDGYRVDLDAFQDGLSARTRLVMVASPQNPSGVSITRDEVAAMLAAMSRRCPEAVLLVDETYREATYGDTPAAPTFAGLSGPVLTCASLSKAYGVPGLRIGWLTAADPGLREQLRLAKFNSSVCCGVLERAPRHPAAVPGRPAARVPGGTDGQRSRATVERWIGEQDGQLEAVGGPARARSAAHGSTRTSSAPRTSAASMTGSASRRTVVAPGPWFGDSAHVMRLGLAYPPDDELEKGLAVISGALRP